MMEAMGRFNDELVKAGVMKDGDGLKPSSEGQTGSRSTALDAQSSTGRFPRPRELVAGFWLWEVKDLDEAVAWVKRCPNPMPGPSEIEIRPLVRDGRLRLTPTAVRPAPATGRSRSG